MTENVQIDFGRYKGRLWTRVPVSYLKFLYNECDKESGNIPCMIYAIRSAKCRLPIDNEVLYGKVGHFGHLIHVSEIQTKG